MDFFAGVAIGITLVSFCRLVLARVWSVFGLHSLSAFHFAGGLLARLVWRFALYCAVDVVVLACCNFVLCRLELVVVWLTL